MKLNDYVCLFCVMLKLAERTPLSTGYFQCKAFSEIPAGRDVV